MKPSLSDAQMTWLKSLYSKTCEGKSVTERTLISELASQLPRDFDPSTINKHFLQILPDDMKILLLGKYIVDSNSEIIERANKVLSTVKKTLDSNPDIKIIYARDIATETGLTEIIVGDILAQLSSVGILHSGGSLDGMGGWESIAIDRQTFMNYRKYETLEQILEQIEAPERQGIFLVSRSENYVDLTRIESLRVISSKKYDFKKLVRLCEELNISWANECYFTTGMLLRAIIDHIPPIFGCNSFAEVANNSNRSKSFKDQALHLQNSLRKIADLYLHEKICDNESLPTAVSVGFQPALDSLLQEIIRLSSSKENDLHT